VQVADGQRLVTDGGEPVAAGAPGDDDDDDDGEEPIGEDTPTTDGEAAQPQTAGETDSEADTVEDGEAEEMSLIPSTRRFIKRDRGNECELCGADGTEEDVTLQIHHRTPQADGGTDTPENLIVLCRECHRRHHGNLPSAQAAREARERSASREGDTAADGDTVPDPLPPHSEPNETDSAILSIVEQQGPVQTGVIAEQVECSTQYVRRRCWTLSGEQLLVRTDDGTWELRERADPATITVGLPDEPERARRAGRDDVLRQMSAHGMPDTEIAEITGLSRSTVRVAVDRARALRLDGSDPETDVDLQAIAMRVSALLDMIEHAQPARMGTDRAAGDD